MDFLRKSIYPPEIIQNAVGKMAKCPKCGRENPSYVIYCGGCGTEIPDELRRATREKEAADEREAAEAAAQRPPSRPVTQIRTPVIVSCPHCGADHEADMLTCPGCGRPARDQWADETSYYSDSDLAESRGASGALTAGGVLAILAGVLALGQGLLYALASSLVPYDVGGSGYLCVCGAVDILFGLGSIAGGVFAMGRKNFGLALAGAVVGMLGFGLVIGFLLGLIALLIIATSKSEFTE